MEYADHVHKLGVTLFEFLSEALGLKSDHLTGLDCAEGPLIISHYYPPCPEPELTIWALANTPILLFSPSYFKTTSVDSRLCVTTSGLMFLLCRKLL